MEFHLGHKQEMGTLGEWMVRLSFSDFSDRDVKKKKRTSKSQDANNNHRGISMLRLHLCCHRKGTGKTGCDSCGNTTDRFSHLLCMLQLFERTVLNWTVCSILIYLCSSIHVSTLKTLITSLGELKYLIIKSPPNFQCHLQCSQCPFCPICPLCLGLNQQSKYP